MCIDALWCEEVAIDRRAGLRALWTALMISILLLTLAIRIGECSAVAGRRCLWDGSALLVLVLISGVGVGVRVRLGRRRGASIDRSRGAGGRKGMVSVLRLLRLSWGLMASRNLRRGLILHDS